MQLDVKAMIVDGNFEGVFISTFGLKSQDDLLAKLKEKYGDPSEYQEEKMQTMGGAEFDSHVAVWRFDNFVVTFSGTGNRVDDGFIVIETKKQREFIRAWKEKSKAADPKL
jgi:hypothetical protein